MKRLILLLMCMVPGVALAVIEFHRPFATATTIPVDYRSSSDGTVITGATGSDCEYSEGGHDDTPSTFAAMTNEATEIATSEGVYYLNVEAAESDEAFTYIKCTSTSSNSMDFYAVINHVPENGAVGNTETATHTTTRIYLETTENLIANDDDWIGFVITIKEGSCLGYTGLITDSNVTSDYVDVTPAIPAGVCTPASDLDGVGFTIEPAGPRDIAAIATGAITNASLAGNLELVFETDFASNYDSADKAWYSVLDNSSHSIASLTASGGVTIQNSSGDAVLMESQGGNGAGLSLIGNGSGAGLRATGQPGAYIFAPIASNSYGASIQGDGTGDHIRTGAQGIEEMIVDEWETQSQADPTGFHVNMLEVGGTAQTANDIGGDVDAVLIDTAEIGAAGAGLTDLGGMSTGMKAEVEAEATDALEADHLDHLFAADYDPASKPGTATAWANEMVESDGGVTRYTANALEQAPSGGLTAIATGTAQAGTATTLQLAAAETFADDELIGAVVVLTGGTGDGQSKCITDYTGSTDTATVSTWTTTPDNTSTYEIVSSLGSECPVQVSDDTSPIQVDSSGYVKVSDGTGTGQISLTAGRAGVALDDTSGTLDAAEIGTDAITAIKIADDAIGAAEAGFLTDSTGFQGADVATILVDTADMQPKFGSITGSGQNTILGYVQSLARSDVTVSSDIGGTYDDAADSLQAIRDRGDAAWTTGSGTGLTGETGTTQTATHSATSVVLASGEVANDDDFMGWVFQVTGGNCAGQKSIVIDSARTTDTVTLRPGLKTDGSGTCTNLDSDLDGVTYELAPYGG